MFQHQVLSYPQNEHSFHLFYQAEVRIASFEFIKFKAQEMRYDRLEPY